MSVTMSKKMVIVSLDLMLALPVLTAGVVFLFSSISGSQSYLLAQAKSQGRYISLLSSSQRIAGALDSQEMNYSSAVALASGMAAEGGLSASIVASADSCGVPNAMCRLVTISGSSYFLVLSNESAG